MNKKSLYNRLDRSRWADNWDWAERFGLINGIRYDFWVINEKQIDKFIKKYDLPRVTRRSLGVPAGISKEWMIDIDSIIGIRGGRKIPHLHFKGELYLLKPKQWREFSEAVVKELGKRLAVSSQVNVIELLDISDSVNSLVR